MEETESKMGTTKTDPWHALKKGIFEDGHSIDYVINSFLPRFETAFQKGIDDRKQIGIFTSKTAQKVLGEEVWEEFKESEGFEIGD